MGSYCYFDGRFVPLEEAQVSIRTHALHYGTGCFEGIRAYWNEEQEQLYVLHLREHFERMQRSARILRIQLPLDTEGLCQATVELLRRNGHREDVYIRPIAYKNSQEIGPRLHDLSDGFAIFALPFGKYLATDKGIRCCVSSWRRVDDNAIPARAKVTGIYVNSALARSEAHDNGYDEAIVLTHDGHVSEGTGENIFLVVGGTLETPSPSDNILVGITRHSIIRMAKAELGIETLERSIDRTELYTADEVFLCGTGAEITPVTEIDRRKIGSGKVGPITAQIQELYFDAARGKNEKYRAWCTPVYP